MGDQWEQGRKGYKGGGGGGGGQWEWDPKVQTMRRGLMNTGTSRWEGTNGMGTNEMGDQWNGWCVGANWRTNEMGDQWNGGPVKSGPLGLAENGWTNEKGGQWEGGSMSSNNVVGDLWIGGSMIRGPMRWGTNELGDQWVGGTNEMGDQWNEWCMDANWGTNEMGDLWDGEPMRYRNWYQYWGHCYRF